MGNNKSLKRIINRYIQGILLAVGVLACVSALILPIVFPAINVVFWQSSLSGIGSSIIGACIISFLMRPIEEKNRKMEELYRTWGLNDIYSKRDEMNATSNIYLEKNSDELDIMSLGLRSFISVKGKDIEDKVRLGMKVRIITLNYNSNVLKIREKEENVLCGTLKKSIVDLEKWVGKLKNIAPFSENVQIKFYDSMLQHFYFRMDKSLFVGPYLYDQKGNDSITYEYEKDSLGFDTYSSYFNKIWNDPKFCQVLKAHFPDFNNNRFLVSPVLGCDSQCVYCYTSLKDYNRKTLNLISSEETVDFIINHKNYKPGEKGSVIALGAWGELFPLNDEDTQEVSLQYIVEVLKIGNPVQIITKNVLSDDLINKLCDAVKFDKQLLFSTTITSFRRWQDIEKNTSNPNDRLETLRKFKNKGIPVNLMIKPFLKGVTDKDIDYFVKVLNENIIDYCVVGNLLWDDAIFKKLVKNKIVSSKVNYRVQSLGCFESKLYTNFDKELNQFLDLLKNRCSSVNIYKKTSCVNSHLFSIPNKSNYFTKIGDDNFFCVKCGQCKLGLKK